MAKVKPDGSGLVYSGFLGGVPIKFGDGISGIAVDAAGAAYVTGVTSSKYFPIVGEFGLWLWLRSGFVTKVKPDASGLTYTALLGCEITEIALDSTSAAYVAGRCPGPQDYVPIIGGLSGDSNSFLAKIIETATPTPPIAANDSYNSYSGYAGSSGLVIPIAAPGVLHNDFNPDGGRLTASVVNAPNHGTLRLDADGGFAYTPEQGYSGTDRFTYKASNSVGDSAPATVALELVQSRPVKDRYDLLGDTISGNVLDNDAYVVVGVTAAAVVSPPRHGSLTLEPNGNFTYTPNPGYQGRDSFYYAIRYGSVSSEPARVTLIVRRP